MATTRRTTRRRIVRVPVKGRPPIPIRVTVTTKVTRP